MKILLLLCFAYFQMNVVIITCQPSNSKCIKKIDCQNNGKFNEEKCSCDCLTNYIGNDCSIGKLN
jgi:hypothetical protein